MKRETEILDMNNLSMNYIFPFPPTNHSTGKPAFFKAANPLQAGIYLFFQGSASTIHLYEY